MHFSITTCLSFLLLGGIAFLKVPILVQLAVAACAASFILLAFGKGKVDTIVLLIGLNFLYWLFSGLTIGSIAPEDLLSAEFYDGEGRIFLAYLPLLYFTVAYVWEIDLKTIVNLVFVTAFWNLFLALYWLATQSPHLTQSSHFIGLLTSHTGAGTFFGFTAVFLFIIGSEAKRPAVTALGAASLLPLLLSGSRQALVSIVTVSIWYALRHGKTRVFLTIAAVALVTVAFPNVAPVTSARISILWEKDLLDDIRDQMRYAEWAGPGRDKPLAGPEFNIMDRIVHWTYAFNRFTDSPAIGIGFARYNDPFPTFVGVPGVVRLATSGVKTFDTASAHNSYLDVLAETGLLGLTLLLSLWVLLWRRLARARAALQASPILRGYYVACEASIVFIMVGAFFDHALAAPSICFPTLVVVGAGIAYVKTAASDSVRFASVGTDGGGALSR